MAIQTPSSLSELIRQRGGGSVSIHFALIPGGRPDGKLAVYKIIACEYGKFGVSPPHEKP
jgi:hypothetical protein